MNVHLGHLEVGEIIIIPFTGQQHVHAVIHVGTNDQRNGFFGICFFLSHLLIDHIDQTVFINDRRGFPNLSGKLDRSIDEMKIILFASGTCRAKAPTALFTRFGTTRILHVGTTSRTTGFRLSNNPRIGLHMERLQPGSATMVSRERNTLTKMRRHMRPRQFAVLVKLDRMAFAGMRSFKFRPFNNRLPLRQDLIAFPAIIPDRTVIRLDLFDRVIMMTGLPLGRKHVLHPVLDIDDRNFFAPITFPFSYNFKLLAKPVHGFTDQFI